MTQTLADRICPTKQDDFHWEPPYLVTASRLCTADCENAHHRGHEHRWGVYLVRREGRDHAEACDLCKFCLILRCDHGNSKQGFCIYPWHHRGPHRDESLLSTAKGYQA